ncbi:hypothetical protein F2P81_023903 [Scophthalmus maximus]|nr:hypothetical protein F2P81_023903 [Scophthalmus maximus]
MGLLLLLSFIRAGVDGLIFAESGYDITFPCEEDTVCFHKWKIGTGRGQYIAIVSNGEIQRDQSEEEKCTLRFKDLTAEDVGRHHCQTGSNGSSPRDTHLAAPVLNLLPAKTVSLQCVFLTFVDQRHCYTVKRQWVRLTWVDVSGAKIQEDSQHQIIERSSCDITLTVKHQRPENKKFRCQARVADQVLTSVEFRVRAPALKGKGRGIAVDLEPEGQGRNQDTVGAAVGVVGCVVVTAVAAVFVLNRRRTNSQLPSEVQSSTNNVTNTDDVIYADIIVPIGSDRVWVNECETTEYACVR